MSKVTQWFSPSIKPAHIGLYQRDWDGDLFLTNHLDFFDGKDWWIMSEGLSTKTSRSINNRAWRGLAEQPK